MHYFSGCQTSWDRTYRFWIIVF